MFGHADDRRLELDPGDRYLVPALYAADIHLSQGDIIARHEAAHVTPVLDVDVVQPFHVGHAVPAGDDQAKWGAVKTWQRLTIHLVGNHDFGAHRIVDVHASTKCLLDIDISNVLVALVGAVKHDFDAVVLQTGMLQQVAEADAAPLRIADQAMIEILAIAAAFEPGINFKFVHGLDVAQCDFERVVHQTGKLQSIAVHIDIRLAVVLNDVEVIVRRIERVDVTRVDKVDRARRFRCNRVVFRDISKWHELLTLSQGEFRPERHTGGCRQTSQHNPRLQNLATIQLTLVRHTLFLQVIVCSNGCSR